MELAAARARVHALEEERLRILQRMDAAAPEVWRQMGERLTEIDDEQTVLLDALQAADPVWRGRSREVFVYRLFGADEKRGMANYKTDAEILEAVRRHGSSSAAAEALGLAPQTVNKRLRWMREQEGREAA